MMNGKISVWILGDQLLERRTGVLMDANGQPEGGKWNFDAANRK